MKKGTRCKYVEIFLTICHTMRNEKTRPLWNPNGILSSLSWITLYLYLCLEFVDSAGEWHINNSAIHAIAQTNNWEVILDSYPSFIIPPTTNTSPCRAFYFHIASWIHPFHTMVTATTTIPITITSLLI